MRHSAAPNGSPDRPKLPRGPREVSATAWAPLLREALAVEGCFHWPLRGNSMRPTLPRECDIDIVPLPDPTPLGSLIVFASYDALIAHRLVRRTARHWIAQGDGRLGPDRPLAPEQILGCVTAAYLNDRRIWPNRAEGLLRWWWVARYHALRPIRFAWRWLRGGNRSHKKGGARA